MLLEFARPISFLLSILSLYPVLMSAFFVPGTQWEERLEMAVMHVLVAACVCFGSGLLYGWPGKNHPEDAQPLLATLPVRVFLWALAGMALLFALSWYLETYFVPLASRDCCRF